MINKLDFLLNQANIGIYNKCEVIEIFGFNKEKKEAFNIYTLIVFENTKQITIEGMMSEKLYPFQGYKNISWGIKRRIVDIKTVLKLYEELLEKNKYQIDKPFNVGKMKLLQEQYVPTVEDMHNEIQLNYILKNNFHNGSYILEFFDEDKGSNQFLLDNRELLNKLSKNINIIQPIKIENIYDRLENIVFQFPINGFKVSHNSIIKNNPRRYAGIIINITPKNKNFNLSNLAIRIFEYNTDNLIIRQRYEDVKRNITEIKLDDCFGTHIEIIDKNTSLLLYKYKFSILKQIYISEQPIHNIQKEKYKSFDEWIGNRIYEQKLKKLEKNKAFIQYFGKEKEKALKDIQWLINQHGKQGVYLWDLFLSAKDIINILSENTHLPLKAITGLKHPEENGKQEIKNSMFFELEEYNKKNLFPNLEVRGKIGSHGYEFHDRFLIFPFKEEARVWSLGISFNQLGASHHILQEVRHSQHILNAFNKLWDELSDKECLVWKSH